MAETIKLIIGRSAHDDSINHCSCGRCRCVLQQTCTQHKLIFFQGGQLDTMLVCSFCRPLSHAFCVTGWQQAAGGAGSDGPGLAQDELRVTFCRDGRIEQCKRLSLRSGDMISFSLPAPHQRLRGPREADSSLNNNRQCSVCGEVKEQTL